MLVFFLLFCGEAFEGIVTATLAYSEQKKDEKKSSYHRTSAKSFDQGGSDLFHRLLAPLEPQWCVRLSAGLG